MAVHATISPVRGFNTVFAAYSAATLLREFAKGDEQVERAEEAIAPLFDQVMTHDVADLSAVISKCSAIMGEYGNGECPAYLVEAVMLDLIALDMMQGGAQ